MLETEETYISFAEYGQLQAYNSQFNATIDTSSLLK